MTNVIRPLMTFKARRAHKKKKKEKKRRTAAVLLLIPAGLSRRSETDR